MALKVQINEVLISTVDSDINQATTANWK